jgi:hypothetical protein
VLFMAEVKHALIIGCISLMIVIPFAGFGQPAMEMSDTLGSSHLAAPVKKRIYQELEKEFRDGGGGLGKRVLDAFPLKTIKLSPGGKEGIRIWAKNQEDTQVCGATGNCDIWVFDPKTGDLLLSGNGWELRSETTTHNGCYDFVTRHNMGAGFGIRDWYRFDGRTYKLWRETDTN